MWTIHDERGYKELHGKQLDKDWLAESKGRIGASRVSTAAGRSRFMTAEQYREIFTGREEDPGVSNSVALAAEVGIREENTARQIYLRECNDENHLFREASMFVPLRRDDIKYSPDLLLYDIVDGKEVIVGLLEIKCPWSIYTDFDNQDPDQEGQGYIFDSHYDQMQTGMEIMDVEWCDYMVYGVNLKEWKYCRVYRNMNHWKMLEEKLNVFFAMP